jgi:hypothetical protein
MKHFILISLSICLLSIQAVFGQITLKTRPFFWGLGITYPLGTVSTVGGYHSSGWGGQGKRMNVPPDRSSLSCI